MSVLVATIYKLKNTVLYYLRLHRASKGLTFELIVKKVLSVSKCGVFMNTCRKHQCQPSWIDSVAMVIVLVPILDEVKSRTMFDIHTRTVNRVKNDAFFVKYLQKWYFMLKITTNL